MDSEKYNNTHSIIRTRLSPRVLGLMLVVTARQCWSLSP